MITDRSVSLVDSIISSKKLQNSNNNIIIKGVPHDLNTKNIKFRLKQQLIEESDTKLYKCQSKDSLPSLQQLIPDKSSGVKNSKNKKKYIEEDKSSYANTSSNDYFFYNDLSITNLPFLKPRMSFTGYQISGYKRYQVTVTLQTVNFPKENDQSTNLPHMTGFLTINGLTLSNPKISTLFEAYAVTDDDFGFFSSTWLKNKDMTATDSTDLEHWLNFPAFKQHLSYNKNNKNNYIEDYSNQRYMFMRWKEKFMLPDPFADSIEGASYDGFYYIVHDQFTGNVQGFYYQKQAERFQQLELIPSNSAITENTSNCSFEFA